MSELQRAAIEYINMRRALGFVLRRQGANLRSFVAFMERERTDFITNDLAVRWATMPPGIQPQSSAGRLSVVRGFAKYMSAKDHRTEIPPCRLLPHPSRRRSPYLYTDDEIDRLINGASGLQPPTSSQPWTYAALFALLAVTGLRIGEILSLDCDDVDLADGILSIRRTKFGKSRLVPVHESTRDALAHFALRRDAFFPRPSAKAFFLSQRGGRLNYEAVRRTFIWISKHIGLREPSDRRGPRIHDLRHRFAVTTLTRWYRDGLNVERQMPLLSTYLGHTHVADTYWYLSAAPELLGLAGARLEKVLGDLP